MRLSIVFLSSVLAFLVSSCDAASAGQTNISKMEITGAAHPEGLAPVANRSLRGYKVNEDEDRAFFGTSIDDIVKKLGANEMTLSHAIEKKRMNKHVEELMDQKNYMNKLFSVKKLKKMQLDPKYAEKKYLEWYALSKKAGLTDDVILDRLKSADDSFETLYRQYVVHIKELQRLG